MRCSGQLASFYGAQRALSHCPSFVSSCEITEGMNDPCTQGTHAGAHGVQLVGGALQRTIRHARTH